MWYQEVELVTTLRTNWFTGLSQNLGVGCDGQYQRVTVALTGVAQWIECWPANRCQFESQSGHSLGCGPGPQLGACERQQIDISCTNISLPLSPFLPLSLKINQ